MSRASTGPRRRILLPRAVPRLVTGARFDNAGVIGVDTSSAVAKRWSSSRADFAVRDDVDAGPLHVGGCYYGGVVWACSSHCSGTRQMSMRTRATVLESMSRFTSQSGCG